MNTGKIAVRWINEELFLEKTGREVNGFPHRGKINSSKPKESKLVGVVSIFCECQDGCGAWGGVEKEP